MTFIDSLSYGLMLVFIVLAVYLTVSLIRTDRKRKRAARRPTPDPLGKETVYGTGVMPTRWFDVTLPVPHDYAMERATVNSADFPGDTPDERLRAALEWAQVQPSPAPMVRVEKGASRYFDGLRSVNGVRLIGGQS